MTPVGQFRPPPSEPEEEEEDIDASLIAPELAIPELAPLLLLPVDDPLAVASEPLPLTPESSFAAPELLVPEPLPAPLEEELEPPPGEFVPLPQPKSEGKPTRQMAHVAMRRFFILVP